MRGALALLLFCTANAQASQPLPLLDQNPLTGAIGLPVAASARLATSAEYSLLIGVSNTSHVALAGQETLVIDGEQHHYRLQLTTPLPRGRALSLTLPYVAHGRGRLDQLVDRFHRFTRLPEGDRPLFDSNDFIYYYRTDGTSQIIRLEPSSGLGDLQLRLGQQLIQRPEFAAASWLGLKLPSGNPDLLLGNGGWSLSLQGAISGQLTSRLWAYAGTALALHTPGRLLPEQQQPYTLQLHTSLLWQQTPRLSLQLQLDGHSAPYRHSALKLLGRALQGSMALNYRLTQGELSIGIVEDVMVGSTTDFTLHLGWRQRLN